jgi:hypothetical protein
VSNSPPYHRLGLFGFKIDGLVSSSLIIASFLQVYDFDWFVRHASFFFFLRKMCDHFWNRIVLFYFIFVSMKRDLFSKAERG